MNLNQKYPSVLLFLTMILSFYSVAEQASLEGSKQFTDTFIKSVFQSESLNDPNQFYQEIEPYLHLRVIGRSLLGLNYRKFNPTEFEKFVDVFSHYEVREILTHVYKIAGKQVDFNFKRGEEKQKQYGFLYKLYYEYETKEANRSHSERHSSQQPGRISFSVLKENNKPEYKITNFHLNGINFLVQRKRAIYNDFLEREYTPQEIINIISSK